MALKNDKVQDPFTYLEKDHRKIAALLNAVDKTTERAVKTRKELFAQIHDQLGLHAEVEEAVVYPVLEKQKTTRAITQEGVEEHHVVKIMLKELSALSPATEIWTAKFKVLAENVEHHVEEEQTDMFPKARKALSEAEKKKLALAMERFLAE